MSIESQPRFHLAALPTPLQEAKRLRAALGGEGRCPRILIKRDDLTGLAFGGNKARMLEFLVADALRQNATVLVTSGAAQSNHARMTAAAARAGRRQALRSAPGCTGRLTGSMGLPSAAAIRRRRRGRCRSPMRPQACWSCRCA